PIRRENVVFCLHCRVAREPALGVVPLRRLVGQVAEPELTGRWINLEDSIAPSTTIRKPLTILQHEINVMLSARHRRRTWFTGIHLRVPMDLRHLGAIRKWLAVTGNPRLIRVDHYRVPKD